MISVDLLLLSQSQRRSAKTTVHWGPSRWLGNGWWSSRSFDLEQERQRLVKVSSLTSLRQLLGSTQYAPGHGCPRKTLAAHTPPISPPRTGLATDSESGWGATARAGLAWAFHTWYSIHHARLSATEPYRHPSIAPWGYWWSCKDLPWSEYEAVCGTI